MTRLKDHIKNIHETNKTYKCPSCHKAFGTMQSKRQHLKIAKSCQKKAMKIGKPNKKCLFFQPPGSAVVDFLKKFAKCFYCHLKGN